MIISNDRPLHRSIDRFFKNHWSFACIFYSHSDIADMNNNIGFKLFCIASGLWLLPFFLYTVYFP